MKLVPVAGQQYIFETGFDDAYLISRPVNEDGRGYFATLANLDELEMVLGYPFVIRQINQSRLAPDVLRGLHINGWNKLIMVVSGSAQCVLVDLRPLSPTFKQHRSFNLSGSSLYRTALYVGKGIANSFLALDDPEDTKYVYLVDKTWEQRGPDDDLAVYAFDSELAIGWNMTADQVIMSEKDRNAPLLAELIAQGKI